MKKIWLTRRETTEIRQRATNLIQDINCVAPPVPVEAIAKKLGIELRYAPYNDGDLAGMLIWRPKPIIAINSAHHKNRQRFTIAHEIGHYLLHADDGVHIDERMDILKRDATSSLAIDRREIEANQFAAELLMPRSMLMRKLSQNPLDIEDDQELIQLAKEYLVSAQAMTFRVANLFM